MAIKTAAGLVAFVKEWVGQPYWYGTHCHDCTTALLKRKAAQYPAHYTAARMPRYRADIEAGKKCADCIGLIKGYMWTDEETGKMRYGSNGCPDRGANGMFSYAKQRGLKWGIINTLPECPGLILWRSGHVGVYIGGGKLVEARGFATGIVEANVADRNFTHWFEMQALTYAGSSEPESEPEAKPSPIKRTTLKRGSSGNDVRMLQNRLNEIGYSCGAADGKFGALTQRAVKRFQQDNTLPANGIADEKTLEKVEKVFAKVKK